MRWDKLDEVWFWTAGGQNALTSIIMSCVAVSFDRTRKFSTPGTGTKTIKQDSFGGRRAVAPNSWVAPSSKRPYHGKAEDVTTRTFWEAATRKNIVAIRWAGPLVLFGWIMFGALAGLIVPAQWAMLVGGPLFGGLLLAAVPWVGGFTFFSHLVTLTFGTLTAIHLIHEITGLPGMSAFMLLALFQVVVAVLTVRLIRKRRVSAAINARQRLAEQLGATFARESRVPIPGSISARLIKGGTDRGHDGPRYKMVYGEKTVYQFAVSQRSPISAANSETGQTLWQHLSQGLPFVKSDVVPALPTGQTFAAHQQPSTRQNVARPPRQGRPGPGKPLAKMVVDRGRVFVHCSGAQRPSARRRRPNQPNAKQIDYLRVTSQLARGLSRAVMRFRHHHCHNVRPFREAEAETQMWNHGSCVGTAALINSVPRTLENAVHGTPRARHQERML